MCWSGQNLISRGHTGRAMVLFWCFFPSGTGGTQRQFGCPSHLLHRWGPRPGHLISSWLPLKTHCKKGRASFVCWRIWKSNQIVGSFRKSIDWFLIKQPALKRWLRVPSLCSGKRWSSDHCREEASRTAKQSLEPQWVILKYMSGMGWVSRQMSRWVVTEQWVDDW